MKTNRPSELNSTRILILEDEPVFVTHLKNIIPSVFPVCELQIFESVPASLARIPDLAIIDIDLEGNEDGIAFMNRWGSQIPAILFYSVCWKRMKEAFGENVIGFVEKGDPDALLLARLKKAKERLEKDSRKKITLLDEWGRTRISPLDQIQVFCKEGRQIYAVDDRNQKYRTEFESLLELETNLDARYFKINRQEIIRLDAVEWFCKDEIHLTCSYCCYVSRALRKKLEHQIKNDPSLLPLKGENQS